MAKAAGVRTTRRLAVGGKICEEVRLVVESSNGNNSLQLLKSNIEEYSHDFGAQANAELRAYLSNTTVMCVDGKQRLLKDVNLATQSVLAEPLAKCNVPMLMVENAHDSTWAPLANSLGLRQDVDAHLFLSILVRMRKGRCPFTTEDVKRMASRST